MTTTSAPPPMLPSQPDQVGRHRTSADVAQVADTTRSLVRSEERLHGGTELVSAGSVRLEKYLVTETRTVTVEVTCERVRLVSTAPDGTQTVIQSPTPTTPSAAGGPAGPDESSRWLVLHNEVAAVTKKQVPVERIRLDTYLVTEQHDITQDVRSERVGLTTDPGVTAAESDTEK